MLITLVTQNAASEDGSHSSQKTLHSSASMVSGSITWTQE